MKKQENYNKLLVVVELVSQSKKEEERPPSMMQLVTFVRSTTSRVEYCIYEPFHIRQIRTKE